MSEKPVVLKIKRLKQTLPLPRFMTEGSVCFDLYASMTLVIPPKAAATVPLGIAAEIPEGYEVQIRPRSFHAFEHSLQVHPGTIDADYRGEWKVRVFNHGHTPYVVRERERIAQGALRPVPKVVIEEVETLSETARGDRGFGSTGV